MANTAYNNQLDAFELYHLRQDETASSKGSGGTALEALGHALSGAAGSAISNAALYPVDLIITRLQIQRQLRKNQTEAGADEYTSVRDAAEKIYRREGGVRGFYTGVVQDTGKTIADAFVFFLAYSYLRERRLRVRPGTKSLPALEELGVGFVSGALTKLATTPIGNVVVRKQAAALTRQGRPTPSARQIARDILDEKGPLGFWSGYSASLVLTLNPSITFFLFETLKKALLPRARRENPPAAATFFLSAISKACASSITYPFSLAKSRLQGGARRDNDGDGDENEKTAKRAAAAADGTLFGMLLSIVSEEGVSALYEGLHVEVWRGFFSHGLTMLVKQAIQRALVRAYYILSIILGRYKHKVSGRRLRERARENVEYYNLAMARAGDKLEQAAGKRRGKAYETAELVHDYVDDETEQWRDLYGTTGLAKWLDARWSDEEGR